MARLESARKVLNVARGLEVSAGRSGSVSIVESFPRATVAGKSSIKQASATKVKLRVFPDVIFSAICITSILLF